MGLSQHSHIPQHHPDLFGSSANEAHPTYKQSGHSLQRPQSSEKWSNKFAQLDLNRPALFHDSSLVPSQEQQTSSNSGVLYIYEPSDSTFGPSLIESYDNLERYLRHLHDTPANSNMGSHFTNDRSENELIREIQAAISMAGRSNTIELSKFDNLDHTQALRNQLTKQRSFPSSLTQPSRMPTKFRYHGLSSLVKSPLFIDELDPLRPIITWPQLESGKIIRLPAGGLAESNIVAIPTPTSSADQPQLTRVSLAPNFDTGRDLSIIEQLIRNLNCTQTEGSIDTHLVWLINDIPVETRDTSYYPTRLSSDSRQAQMTIGFSHNSRKALRVSDQMASDDDRILARHLGSHNESPIRFACVATHSMLLYSSSEMITFDFSPSQISQNDDNSLMEKMASSPSSNVIQAASGEFDNSTMCLKIALQDFNRAP